MTMTKDQIQALQALAEQKSEAWENVKDGQDEEKIYDAGDDLADMADKVPALCADLLAAKAEVADLRARYCPTMTDMQAQTDAVAADPVALDAFMAANPLPDGRALSDDLEDFIGNVARLMDSIMVGYYDPNISHEDFRAQVAVWATDMQADARKAKKLLEAVFAEVARLREVLGPFAQLRDWYDPSLLPLGDKHVFPWANGLITYGDLRRAHAELEGGK